MNEKRTYRKFTPQKLELVMASWRGERSIAELCREHDISESLLRRWRWASPPTREVMVLTSALGAQSIDQFPRRGVVMSDAGAVQFATGQSRRDGEGAGRHRVLRGLAAAAVATVSMALAATPAVFAAAPEVNRFHDVGTDVDPDFCGTGTAIDIAFDIRGVEWLAPRNADYRNVTRGLVTFTNPLTGAVVINRFSGPYVERFISGDPEGVHVVESSYIGLPELIKTAHGGVLTRDAGYITLRNTFDGEELINQEVVINRGPHPEADSDFELFCDVATEALGI